MSALRPFVLGIVVWGVVAHEVRAEPISWQGWLTFIVGQTEGGSNRLSAGRFSGPIVSSTPPASWSRPPITNTFQPQPIISNGPLNGGLIASSSVNTNVGAVPVGSPLPPQPAPTPPPAPVSASPPAPVDAFINLGAGSYPAANSITTGNAQPWYNSAQVASLFGGQPTIQQQQSFDNTILQRVQQTFSLSGVPIALTDNPNVSALHTLSLVSNTTSASLPTAIGMTQVGGNGFSFVDVSAKSAQSIDQLEWIVAHNISHEVMLAFGVGENYDSTGKYIDSKVANWTMMVDPNATFGQAAARAIMQALAAQNGAGTSVQLGAQLVNESPVPEPAALVIWTLAASGLFLSHRARSRRRSAA